jgi:hypothetical protein
MKKLPQKPESHKNSGIAKQQLREIFGDGWNMSDPKDIDSGIEYGLDFLIEIVTEKGDVTGQQFGVQSKVLSKKSRLTSYGIGEPIKTSTLNYLCALSFPVLMHFIDKPTGNGYVIWLSEWLKDNPTHKWQDQKEKKINIPLRNVFDKEMVKSIMKDVDQFYFIHNLRKQADQINKHSKDHYVDVTPDYDTKNATTIIHALHDGAVPTLIPLDEDASQSLREAIEYGKTTKISGKFSISNIPADIFDDPSNIEIVDGEFFPILDNAPSHPIRISFISSNNEILYSVNYLEIKPIQIGTKLGKWSASILDDLISFTLAVDVNTGRAEWSFKSHTENVKANDPKVFLEYYRFSDALSKAQYVDLELLRENHVSRFDIPETVKHSEENPYLNALEDIVYISNIFKIEVSIIPSQLSGEEINYINAVANILKTGEFEKLIPQQINETDIVIKVVVSYEKAQEILTSVKQRNEPILIQHSEDTYANILEKKLNLGSYDLVLHEVEFQNEDEINQQLGQKSDNITIIFRFDLEKSYTQFPKWLPEETDNA